MQADRCAVCMCTASVQNLAVYMSFRYKQLLPLVQDQDIMTFGPILIAIPSRQAQPHVHDQETVTFCPIPQYDHPSKIDHANERNHVEGV